jgi:hypothetical protein
MPTQGLVKSVKDWFKRTKKMQPKVPGSAPSAPKGFKAESTVKQVRDAYSSDPVKRKSDFGKINKKRKKREALAKEIDKY